MVINIWANGGPGGKLPDAAPDGRDWSPRYQTGDLSFTPAFQLPSLLPPFALIFLEDLISQLCGEELQISQEGMKSDSPNSCSSPSEESVSVCRSVFDFLYSFTGALRTVSSSCSICSSDFIADSTPSESDAVSKTGTYGRTVAGWLWKLPAGVRSRISHAIMGL